MTFKQYVQRFANVFMMCEWRNLHLRVKHCTECQEPKEGEERKYCEKHQREVQQLKDFENKTLTFVREIE